MDFLINSLIFSAIYDCLKAGVVKLNKEIFKNKVLSQVGNENITNEQFNALYSIINEILLQLSIQQKNNITVSELSEILNSVPAYNEEFGNKIYNITLQRAEDYFDEGNYDEAIKFYNKAEIYQNNNYDYSYILWKKFLCYVNIENYYLYVVEYKGSHFDLQNIYNFCDYNTDKTISNISSSLGISKADSRNVLSSMLYGVSCSIVKRKFAVKENQIKFGFRALELTKDIEIFKIRQSFLCDCVIINL